MRANDFNLCIPFPGLLRVRQYLKSCWCINSLCSCKLQEKKAFFTFNLVNNYINVFILHFFNLVHFLSSHWPFQYKILIKLKKLDGEMPTSLWGRTQMLFSFHSGRRTHLSIPNIMPLLLLHSYCPIFVEYAYFISYLSYVSQVKELRNYIDGACLGHGNKTKTHGSHELDSDDFFFNEFSWKIRLSISNRQLKTDRVLGL